MPNATKNPLLALTAAVSLALTLSVSAVSAESQRAFAGRISMTGAAEVPGPGDPDASGTAIIVIVPALDRVCWMLSWDDIDGTVSAAHIHGSRPPARQRACSFRCP